MKHLEQLMWWNTKMSMRQPNHTAFSYILYLLKEIVMFILVKNMLIRFTKMFGSRKFSLLNYFMTWFPNLTLIEEALLLVLAVTVSQCAQRGLLLILPMENQIKPHGGENVEGRGSHVVSSLPTQITCYVHLYNNVNSVQ